jgi:glycosyltransferase involved in cell wall biosynthesis
MKILLIGEYSRLHNSLKEGLEALGHEALIVSSGDAFKNYKTGLSTAPKFMQGSAFMRIFRKAIHRLTGIDAERAEKGLRFYRLLPSLKGYDFVQLINSDALETYPWLAKKLLKKLFTQNGSMSLLICGDETPLVDYALTGKLKYSILTPYLADNTLAPQYEYSLKYTRPAHRNLFEFVKSRAKSITTSDLDYQIPMLAMGYNTRLIPNPINTNAIQYTEAIVKDKVYIFLGINSLSYNKKGITYFEEALTIVSRKYSDSVKIMISENIPYAEYIELYNSAHIVLDQVYAYDQGYNALEAMAKGKVVFTGAETEFIQQYNLTDKVAVNALPNAQAIADELIYLIQNPAEITAISKRARAFIEREHDYITVVQKYLDVWMETANPSV